jgi:hypothetical protein
MKGALLLGARSLTVALLSCLAAVCVAGCGPQVFIIQQYAGPVRDSETIAILRINGADSTRVLTLDGELADPRIAEDTRLHIEMLPGRHSVRVAGGHAIAFDAEAGRVYRAVLEGDGAKVLEVDRGSDQPLRDATARPAERPALSPADAVALPRGLAPVLAPEPAGAPSAAPPEPETPPAPVIDPTTPPQP